MSRYSPTNGQARLRIAAFVAIASALALTACGRSDPTAPATPVVNPWAVGALAPCPSDLVLENHGAGRSASDARVRALGTTNASSTSRCRSTPCVAMTLATCEPPRRQDTAAVSPGTSSAGRCMRGDRGGARASTQRRGAC
jgi:hypothetical protein